MIEGTATEILAIISKERNWHKALISPALASSYKKQLKAGKLLNSTAEKMLYKLGYRKIKKEQWSEQQKILRKSMFIKNSVTAKHLNISGDWSLK
mgnify:CR=1 FL=1